MKTDDVSAVDTADRGVANRGRRTMFVADGGKGGIGKTIAAIVAADRLIDAGTSDTAIVDGDITNADVSVRFSDSGATIAQFDLRAEAEWTDALDFLDEIQARRVVVNLPATARITDRNRAAIREALDEMGFDLSVAFLLDRNADSVDLIDQCVRSGLISIADRFAPVVNEYSAPKARFSPWNASQVRARLLADARCVGEIVIDELYHTAVKILDEQRIPPSRIAAAGGMPVATGAQLRSWLRRTAAALEPLIG